MSDDKAESSKADEQELVDLMDSALKDFNQTKPKNTDDELDDLMAAQDQQAAQKAAGDFQKMLEQMVQVQEEAIKRSEGETDQLNPSDPESKAMLDAIKQLMECSSNVANASSAEEFMAGLEMLRSPDSPMEPFMSMIMQTLASKEVMFPPLKEIHDNFPQYMKEHEAELDPETKERYVKQYEVLGQICAEFENQPDAPTVEPHDVTTEPSGAISSELNSSGAEPAHPPFDEAAAEHFEKLGKLLVKLQSLGYPPKELVGALPEGWVVDETGLPKVQDVGAASETCTIM